MLDDANWQAVKEFRELRRGLRRSFERLSAKLQAINDMIERRLEEIRKIREGAKTLRETL